MGKRQRSVELPHASQLFEAAVTSNFSISPSAVQSTPQNPYQNKRVRILSSPNPLAGGEERLNMGDRDLHDMEVALLQGIVQSDPTGLKQENFYLKQQVAEQQKIIANLRTVNNRQAAEIRVNYKTIKDLQNKLKKKKGEDLSRFYVSAIEQKYHELLNLLLQRQYPGIPSLQPLFREQALEVTPAVASPSQNPPPAIQPLTAQSRPIENPQIQSGLDSNDEFPDLPALTLLPELPP